MIKKAPYDQRNQADYAEITTKIELALTKIGEDLTIPANEKILASLAGCSRGTLRNRVFPLVRLKEIKKLRVAKRKNKLTNLNDQYVVEMDAQSADDKVLQNQLENSRNEAALWFDKCLDLEAKLKKYRRLNHLLRVGKKALEEKNIMYKNLLKNSGLSSDKAEGKKLYLVKS